MAKRKSEVFPDPTVPDVAVEIDGHSYRLCFDFAALAIAKRKLRECGAEVNILSCLNFRELDVDTLPPLFFAAAQRFQPEMSYAEALRIVNLRTAEGIFTGIFAAYSAAMGEKKENPPTAEQKS